MKRIHLYAVNFVLLLFSACSSNNDDIQDSGISPATLSIEVFAGDFVETGNTATRAFDNENVTTFETDDQIGIIVLGEDESVLPGNIPYRYTSSKTWTSAASSAGKEAIIYDSKATYLAYFPYSQEADHVRNIDELKEIFNPLSDQKTKENYRASDLLVWEGKPIETSTTGLKIKKILRINFQHAYSSLSLLPSIACKINNNNKDFTYTTSSIDEVSFTVNDMEPFKAYKADDGIYRIIIPPQEEETIIHWSCMYEGATCNGTAKSNTLSENTRYKIVSTVKDIGIYNEKQAKAGDFYCIDEDTKNGYLIPGEATSLPPEVKCIGIVYWTGDVTGDNYGLLDNQYSHGLVVSSRHLTDPDKSSELKMSWTYGSMESVMTIFNQEGFDFDLKNYDLQEKDNMQGYANTQVLLKYNTYVENSEEEKYEQDSKYRIKPIYALENFEKEYSSPLNSSGWYWPSNCELKYMYQKQQNDTNTEGEGMLNVQFKKIDGEKFETQQYWSSTEYDEKKAYYVNFSGGRNYQYEKTTKCYVRPILAF